MAESSVISFTDRSVYTETVFSETNNHKPFFSQMQVLSESGTSIMHLLRWVKLMYIRQKYHIVQTGP